MFLPWGNTWITPHLGPADGLRMRNVGIDRNVLQAEEATLICPWNLRVRVAEPALEAGAGGPAVRAGQVARRPCLRRSLASCWSTIGGG